MNSSVSTKMNITSQIINDIYQISIDGEIDASSSILLDEEFEKGIASSSKKILVDCSHLSYISSAGLGVFMSNVEDCQDKDIKFVLYNLNIKIKSVFDMLGLNHLIQIKSNKEEALIYLNG